MLSDQLFWMLLKVLLYPLVFEPVNEVKTKKGAQPQWSIFIDNYLITIIHELIDSFADIIERISKLFIAYFSPYKLSKQLLGRRFQVCKTSFLFLRNFPNKSEKSQNAILFNFNTSNCKFTVLF